VLLAAVCVLPSEVEDEENPDVEFADGVVVEGAEGGFTLYVLLDIILC
jgi:hypothetical protein